MLDLFNLPSSTQADVKIFRANTYGNNQEFQQWTRPRGKTMAYIICIGSGGNGGTGVIGANSTAAGGGGGGSGGQSTLMIPIILLPDVLWVTVGTGSVNNRTTQIAITPSAPSGSYTVLYAFGGAGGGNASGASAGGGGAKGSGAGINNCVLAGMGIVSLLQGQDGGAGGTTGAAADLALSTTGLIVTGGTGGGGLPAAAATGTNGGSLTVPAAPTIFVPHTGGVGPSVATNPADPGSNGFQGLHGLLYSYGGMGSSSTHGSATGGGLVQASAGKGGPGSGGGGMGGALTGSTAAAFTTDGSEGFCAIICW